MPPPTTITSGSRKLIAMAKARARRSTKSSMARAAPPGIAQRARMLVLGHPRQRHVPPFAGDALVAGQHAAVHHDAAAYAGAQDGAEHDARAAPRAVDRLRQREAAPVVGEAPLAPEPPLEVGLERPVVERRVVGIGHPA